MLLSVNSRQIEKKSMGLIIIFLGIVGVIVYYFVIKKNDKKKKLYDKI